MRMIRKFLQKTRMGIIKKFLSRKPDLDIGSGRERKGKINLDIDKNVKPNIIGDAEKLPFLKHSFKTIVSSHLIEHIKHLDTFLVGIDYVLKPNGKAIFITPNYGNVIWRTIESVWDAYYRYFVGGYSPKTHYSHFTSNSFRSLLMIFFKQVKIEKKLFGMELWAVVIKKDNNH